jgi:peptidoglycan/xylan/chitin deacetylase (PgdA/CDA1 family)
MRRWVVVGVVAAGSLLVAGAGIGVSQAQTTSAFPQIGVSTVQYDSPGAVVPAIVTLYHVPAGATVAIGATGTAGSTATCTGTVWLNPVRHTASRTCYLSLPLKAGNYNVRGAAVVTHNGVARNYLGLGGRAVAADGVASPTPMTMAQIQLIEHCGNTSPDVWLTFDDGGSPAQVNSILATLKRNNVQGRFFFRGDWARKNAALARAIRRSGHLVENHTDTHPALSRMSASSIVKQMNGGVGANSTPKLLRPPFGAGAFTTRLDQVAGTQGYELCRWTTDTYDWEGTSTAQMVERVRYGDYRSAPVGPGGVILMHGHGKYTSPGLQQIIDTVKARKLSLPKLS